MRNVSSIIILLYLYVNIVAAKNPIQYANYENSDSTHLSEIEDFNFVFSQEGWKYSTFNSMYVDKINVINDTTYLDGDQFITTDLRQCKIVLTNEEKIKIYIAAKNVKFDILPDYLELKNIYYYIPGLEQTISIYFANKKHSVTWDGIYPDIGTNKYVLKHRKLVDRYKELSVTIYSILIKKIEIIQLYHKGSKLQNPMNINGINLKDTGFPKKHIPKIGKYKWSGLIVS
jgi:hypothetical protein